MPVKRSNSKAIAIGTKNLKENGFQKNPQNINRTGANRKTIASVNVELEGKGCIAASPKDITDCYLRLVGLTLTELTKMVSDSDQPAMVRIVGKAILGGKGFDVIEKMLDRGIGKAVQNTNIGFEKEQSFEINIKSVAKD